MVYSIKQLPQYTREEEIINSITHYLGAIMAIGISIFFIIFSINNNKTFEYMIPYYIYSFFMFFMFFMSGFYHSRPFNSKARAISRVIDHSDIYFFIAGTYTPISIYAITNHNVTIGVLIFIWVSAIIGLIINNFGIHKAPIKILGFVLYVVMGWLIAFLYPFNIGIPFNVFMLLLFGGISYSLGSVLYWIGKKRKYFHSIFHVFVLLGAIIQFCGIYLLLIH